MPESADYARLKEVVDLFTNNLLFLLIAYFFGLKGLNFRRLTLMGKMLCLSALTMCALYVLAFVRQWVSIELLWWVTAVVRVYLVYVLFRALQSMSWTYGGWGALHRRAWRNLKEMIRLRRIPIEYDPADRRVD